MHFDHQRFYLGGAEICCWQFNGDSTPLTDSSAIPAVGPTAPRGAIGAVGQNPESGEPSSGERQGWAAERGKHNLGNCVCTACQPWMVTLTNGEGNGAAGQLCLGGSQGWGEGGCWIPGALHIRDLKEGPQMPEKFHHVSGISFQVTDYHCWFLGLQCSSANGSIKS